MVECAGLEIRFGLMAQRGFESHPFRQSVIAFPSFLTMTLTTPPHAALRSIQHSLFKFFRAIPAFFPAIDQFLSNRSKVVTSRSQETVVGTKSRPCNLLAL